MMKRKLLVAGFGSAMLALIAAATIAMAQTTAPAPVPAVPPSAQTEAPAAAPVADADAFAEAIPEAWPMPVEDFMAGNYLERADVVLTRRDWDLTSWMIRWATNSPFSHAAMVFTSPQLETGYSNTFVIEAGTGGVDLTNLRDYIADKSAFLAIKRFKKEWFDAPKRARVRGLLLDKIKASYNYWAIGYIARNLWFGVERSVSGDKEALRNFRERDWDAPNEYICSGLVQIGFVEAILEYIKSDQLPPSAIGDVVFEPVAATRLPEKDDWQYLDPVSSKTTAVLFRKQNFDALQSVTPEDLASSDKLEWLYFIKNGMVYKVSSYDEVRKLIE